MMPDVRVAGTLPTVRAWNGVMVNMRTMPRELQEQAHELGLIPFVPGAGSV